MLSTADHAGSAPPRFLRLAGHPLRWRLLSELARSDLRVGELCALAGRRQSLVSYHLRQLRDGRLVSARRSAADGRDTYYVLDLARCGELLSSAGAALHPALASTSRPRGRARVRVPTGAGAVPVHRQQRALADGRGARRAAVRRRAAHGQRGQPSQAAASRRGAGDARARHRSRGASHEAPQRVRRAALRLRDQPLRSRARGLPGVRGRARADPLEHADPGRERGSDEETLPAFERTATELCSRIGFLIEAVATTPPIRR